MEKTVEINKTGIDFTVYGREDIEAIAIHQMYQATKLPVARGGALMPDAHAGYGLPIGGVLATDNAVIPYAVGVDIGCRMHLSVYAVAPEKLDKRASFFRRELLDNTVFGSGGQLTEPADHPVLQNRLFNELPILKNLHGKAWKQLGSSGSGNHFAEFGEVRISDKDSLLNLEPGNYIGFLTHSGSRALGANIAQHYTKIAQAKRQLKGEGAALAWLTMDEAEGIEYWLAMNLAGDYAAACHDIIHEKISAAMNSTPIARVANHHNFAWKEKWQGRNVIVHRKGATPAGLNVAGIIPASMTAPGYIVKGKGDSDSLFSASHGAGRKMSRSRANGSIKEQYLKTLLQKAKVTLLGGGTDEAPPAYKDLDTVMKNQQHLVTAIGKFLPKIVRMDGPIRQWQ
jgi:tRNA-splicing ligase RtcB (3'-phosphate/5'-hydroxy nucleic acid ligase)